MSALELALAALKRGRPQIVGVLVQQDFDEAIAALEAQMEMEPHFVHLTGQEGCTLDPQELCEVKP